MPNKKVTTKKKKPQTRKPRVIESVRIPEESYVENSPREDAVSEVAKPKDSSRSIYGAIAVAVILAAVFLVKNGYIVAAIVNGKPIFRWQVTRVLYDRYGAQTMEGIITESLIDSEAARNNLTVTEADVTAQEQQILKSFGTALTLEDLLKYQGMTKDEFDKQIKLQLTVEKLAGKNVSVTDAEIANYIATSSAKLTATTEADLKEEARKIITDEMVSKNVQPWFAEIKNKAQILRFP